MCAERRPGYPAEMHALLALAVLAGTWVGESICVGTKRPACKDEVVRYHIPAPDAQGHARIVADKKVGGEWGVMGELDCVVADPDTLVCAFGRPGLTAEWRFTVKGDALEGTLTVDEGGGKYEGRKAKARRER